MATPIIEVENLAKNYTLGAIGARTLRGALEELWRRKILKGSGATGKERARGGTAFQALKDVSFEVGAGEILGIIGRNGAGKSTLLKILSRITEPSAGRAVLRGRVASILEVGTGFHPELSGRDNIFLNGAMLGMKRSETKRKLDDIIGFAEVGPFVDTPVKRYSSGMYVRLAFAVAAHLEPEILIVDEVLAVGDAAFQQRCIGKMSEVSHQGRTVLFVSHNMDAVRRLCTRCILLDQGLVEMEGDTDAVTSRYFASTVEQGVPGERLSLAKAERSGSGDVRIEAVVFRGPQHAQSMPATNQPFEVMIEITAKIATIVRCFALMINDPRGIRLINAEIASCGKQLDLGKGKNRVLIRLPRLHLNPGSYTLGFWIAPGIHDELPFDHVESAVSFEVVETDPSGFSYPCAVAPVSCEFEMEVVDGGGNTRQLEAAL